ncbi:MAG: family 78 glycoside hydrolase catalytic domain [Cyclobacteriaceae bacterium]
MILTIKNLRTEYKVNPIGIATQHPRLSWHLTSEQSEVVQTSYRVMVGESSEDLETENYLWDSGKQESEQSIHVEYHGPDLTSTQRLFWQVEIVDNYGNQAKSSVAFWQMGLLDISDWQAQWITPIIDNDISQSEPCPYLRKDFEISKEVKAVNLYGSALGLYELELNGKKVGEQVFTPGWTNYHERIQYQVYDITSQINAGKNAIGAILGDGWFRGHFGWWEDNRNTYGKHLALILQIEIAYLDGTKELVITDDTWGTSQGPILKSDIYNGELYDARLEFKDWSKPSFDDSDWKPTKILSHSKELLITSEGEEVRKTKELKPIELLTTPKEEKVFDLGQNMVGWVRLQVSGNAGDQVTMKFAEVLDQDGNFYTDNLRAIECTDRYFLSGKGLEIYEPRFTFHGFRYVKVEDYSGELNLGSITGIVVHSDMEQIGHFECSDPLINQLQSNIEWGQRGNFLDVPTDCPQRDERLGWTGDAQVFAPTASFNFNTAPFFTKWLKDLATEQKEDGSVPWVVPNIIKDGGGTGWSDGFGATGWADAAVIIPWTLYRYYGDTRILMDQFDSMKAWVDYMIHHAGDKYVFDFGFHFGDWLSFAEYYTYNYNAPDYGYAGAHTDKELIATAYFYYSATLLQKSAEIIGRREVADQLNRLLPKIKKAWNEEFMTRSGRLVSSTQAAYAIGLVFGIVADDKVEVIAKRLADDVSYFGHLTTGFLGTPVLNFALSDFGNTDLAFQLLHNDRYPSWLYAISQGATTIWERWDGIKPDGTFQTVGMNSFNHYAYGAIGDWLYSRVAGIDIDEQHPGFKNIIFRPHIGDKLTYAKASIKTMYGVVSAGWSVEGSLIKYELEIPANCTGTIMLESKKDTSLNGERIALGKENKLKLGSGKYLVSWSK